MKLKQFNDEARSRIATRVAYLGLFTLLAGDAVRYSVGWWGWGAMLLLLLGFTSYLFFTSDYKRMFKLLPLPLTLLLGLMAASTIWSNYAGFTALATFAQLATTLFGVYLAGAFSWRRLLEILGNTLRFILGASLVFEFIAAAIVRGPIAPIFKNYKGDKPPAEAFYWSRGHLFDGERIQGIVGNSNLLAYIAMLGLAVFAIEYVIAQSNRWMFLLSLVTTIGTLWLAKSAGVTFAVAAMLIAAIVALSVEGRDRDTRHRTYRWVWAVAGLSAILVFAFRKEVFGWIGKTPDMTGRTKIWKLVLGLIGDRPIQGWGWLSYWVPGVKPYAGLVVIDRVPYYQAHNAYLDTWLQVGIFGLLLLLWFVTLAFVKLWRLAVRQTNPLYLWPMLVFFGILAQNLTESRMLLESGWLLLVLLAVKVNEPAELLEPGDGELKRVRLLDLGLRRNQSLQRKDR
ncbi:MAG: hypothetical protein RLZZ164_449 [Actinomycetota bacterium]|jgi:O-antigen ligase